MLLALFDNSFFSRELKLTFRGFFKSKPGMIFLVCFFIHLFFMAAFLEFGELDKPTSGNPDFMHLCIVFSSFHVFIIVAPSLILAKLRGDILHQNLLQSMKLTFITTTQRVAGTIMPRFLLCLGIMLSIYFSMFVWHQWLWGTLEQEAIANVSGLEFFVKIGRTAIFEWHPFVTLSYFIISFWFSFSLSFYLQARFKNWIIAMAIAILIPFMMEVTFLVAGSHWHQFGNLQTTIQLTHFKWPMVLYLALVNYYLMSGPIFLFIKLLLAFSLNRRGVKLIDKMEKPIY